MFDRTVAETSAATSLGRLGRFMCSLLAALCLALLATLPALAQTAQPRTVNFLSADGKTNLVGYLFAPAGRPKTAPAVVLMHGRGGVYSPRAKGNYSSVTMNQQIRDWAQLWSAQGYWALVVDSFGPRGVPGGFSAAADRSRPTTLNDVTVRPLDAYGALRYLRSSPRVRGDRIGIEGWSDGGSAVLATMSAQILPASEAGKGFRAALAFYPACGLQGRIKMPYVPYGPVRIFMRALRQLPARSSQQRARRQGAISPSRCSRTSRTVSTIQAAHGRRCPPVRPTRPPRRPGDRPWHSSRRCWAADAGARIGRLGGFRAPLCSTLATVRNAMFFQGLALVKRSCDA